MNIRKVMIGFVALFAFLLSSAIAQAENPSAANESSIYQEEMQLYSTFAEIVSSQGLEPAIEYFENQCAEHPEDSILCVFLGDVYREYPEDNEKAWQHYQKAYQLTPDIPRIKYSYGLGCILAEHYEEGLSIFRALCEDFRGPALAEEKQEAGATTYIPRFYYFSSLSGMIQIGIALDDWTLIENTLAEKMAQIGQDEMIETLRDIYPVLEYLKKAGKTDLFLQYADMYIDLYHEACKLSQHFDPTNQYWLMHGESLYVKQVEFDMQNMQE